MFSGASSTSQFPSIPPKPPTPVKSRPSTDVDDKTNYKPFNPSSHTRLYDSSASNPTEQITFSRRSVVGKRLGVSNTAGAGSPKRRSSEMRLQRHSVDSVSSGQSSRSGRSVLPMEEQTRRRSHSWSSETDCAKERRRSSNLSPISPKISSKRRRSRSIDGGFLEEFLEDMDFLSDLGINPFLNNYAEEAEDLKYVENMSAVNTALFSHSIAGSNMSSISTATKLRKGASGDLSFNRRNSMQTLQTSNRRRESMISSTYSEDSSNAMSPPFLTSPVTASANIPQNPVPAASFSYASPSSRYIDNDDDGGNNNDDDGYDDSDEEYVEKKPKGKGKEKGSTTKKPRKTKDKDAPKRPLSSYNYFFQQEREKLVKEAELNNKAGHQRGRKTAGTGFKKLATIISSKWKQASPEQKKPLEVLAAKDLERYRLEKLEYEKKKAAEKSEISGASRALMGVHHGQVNQDNNMGLTTGVATRIPPSLGRGVTQWDSVSSLGSSNRSLTGAQGSSLRSLMDASSVGTFTIASNETNDGSRGSHGSKECSQSLDLLSKAAGLEIKGKTGGG